MVFPTRTFQRMHGNGDGTTGIDDDFAARGLANIGAWILGRNMFGPVRGSWPDENWKGWWGDTPPYHTPVFVLTHHAREPVTMNGGTTFHFVTDGIHRALERATAAANGQDIRPSPLFCWARGKICSPVSTCLPWTTNVWNTSPRKKPPMSS